MEDEPVQAEIVEAYEEHEEGHRRRGLGIGPIIAIVIAVLLISAILFYVLYDPDVESIEIINPHDFDTDSDGNYDSVQFEIIATSVGPWRVDGTAKIEISVGGAVTYAGEADIKGDRSVVDIPFNKFVTRNGNYAIRVSMDGTSSTNDYRVVFVPNALKYYMVEAYDSDSGEWYHSVSVTPLFSDGTPTEIANYNMMYDVTIDVDGPEGFEVMETYTMRSLAPESFLVRKTIESEYMGFHDISVIFENKLVKEGAENRELTNETKQVYLNRPPMITDVKYPSTIRTNEEVTFVVTATDPDRNDQPSSLTVFWDSANPNSEESDTVNISGSSVSVSHTYTSSGDKVLYFSVSDSGDYFSKEENYRKYNDTLVEINVRGGILG